VTSVPAVPGFYGKVPAVGDFVVRRLPACFVQPWDVWLQEALSASRDQLGSEWLDLYLISPIWRFVLSPGNCGDKATAGVLMPSVDKVGRYFPLTLAAVLNEPEVLPDLFVTAASWFDTLEHLALSALEYDFRLDEFDMKLQEQFLLVPSSLTERRCKEKDLDPWDSDFGFHFEMENIERLPDVFRELSARLVTKFFSAYSMWSTSGSERMKPSFLVYGGLPPAHVFSDFLTGNWQRYADNGAKAAMLPSAKPNSLREHTLNISRNPGAGSSIHWRSHGRSTVGKVRSLNEDAYLEHPAIGLWAVADGMGGHLAGDEASKAVVDALRSISGADALQALTANVMASLQATNIELLARAKEKQANQIMGSTVVVMVAVGESCASIWVGDSRLYRFRNGLLSQLTRDHSMASEMLLQNSPSSGAPGNKEPDSVLTRALGASPELDIDILTFKAKPGDMYLLCSDGLFKEVNPHEITEILSRPDCKSASAALIDLALARSARDNVTVVIVAAEKTPESC